MPLIELKNVHVKYGYIEALKGIDIAVNQGEIVTLIGSNGAGKSTLVKAITHLVPACEGQIVFDGDDITRMQSSKIVEQKKISLAPEGREVFPELSVEKNLQIGAYTVKDKAQIAEAFSRVYKLFPRLEERKKQTAGTLSGGEQQMLAIGRALMITPRLLLLDEPSLGLAPNLVEMIFELIVKIREQGTTVLLIEQNANMALSIADRAYVIETGNIVLEGKASEIASNPKVRAAYLGGE
jgi:branched-chain amino acid transport system ATP-binding protein